MIVLVANVALGAGKDIGLLPDEGATDDFIFLQSVHGFVHAVKRIGARH